MPAGRKNKKNKNRSKRKRTLLEKTNRDRDEGINESLNETVVHLSRNSSYQVITLSASPASPFHIQRKIEFGDLTDDSFIGPCTPASVSYKTPLFNTSTMTNCFDSEELYQSPPACAISPYKITVPSKYNYTNILFNTFLKVVTFIQQILIFVTKKLLSINEKEVNTVEKLEKPEVVMKLDLILSVLERLETRQELLMKRVDAVEQSVITITTGSLKSVCAPPSAPPLPPPPPPLPLPQLTMPVNTSTPIKREKNKSSTTNAIQQRLPPITLNDILNVKLKKTPRPNHNMLSTPAASATVPRNGPYVSVDMLRSVKLRQTRRKSIERSLRTPSRIFRAFSP